jgi:glycosyltransferase involved in cell wall biosynthesis
MPAVGEGRTPILYIAPWVDLGGSDKGTIDWFKHIDRTRWAPSLITTQPSDNRWLHHVEPWAEEVWDLPDLMPGAEFPGFILGFIESRGVRVVHIMNSRLAFDLLPDLSCLREPPAVVVQMHAEEPDRSGYVRYVSTRYGNLVDAFSATSRQLRDAIAAYDIPPSRVEVIYSGVDAEEEFNPELVRPLPDLDGDRPRILWPGRLVEQKDPMLTLDVLAAVKERGTGFTLHVVGDGHMAPDVRRRAAELGVIDSIRWHPPAQGMARWYRSSDLLLMTSVFEGVPYVIYEALAMGVPVVAPALPGNLEFMDEDSGVLVEPRDDVDRYADALADLLGDEERRRAMGERSRERMLSEFSLREMGRRHDELYERLLASRPATARATEVLEEDEERFGSGDEAPAPLRLGRDPLPERTVGLIVPCYRHGIFLRDCIRSIKDQTLPPAAIVVVDDGSDDEETVRALAELEGDPDVKVLRQPANSGPSAARNLALRELDTNYVLPLDADDMLMPNALETMVEQLEAAPPDVGFIYPNPQHIGNRSDYVRSPAYNLWLLMGNNYCPAAALFDRRVFEAGAEYPEDVVFGHEDWDLVLQLAEREVYGRRAEGPTFLYRRRGFSRVNAVEYGPDSFHEAIKRRHPSLYRRRDLIKARWAPTMSILLLDEDDRAWSEADLEGLPEQSCRDYELLTRGPDDGSPRAWLREAVATARGRWLAVLVPRAAAALRDRTLVEKLIRSLWGYEREALAVVLGEVPGLRRAGLSQLSDAERRDARPVGVMFARRREDAAVRIELGLASAPIEDIVLNLQGIAPVLWRLVPAAVEPERAAAGAAADTVEARL